MNSLHSHACTHVTPLGNHFTVLNSMNDDATVFNLNQVNTSECCNDDYVECNQQWHLHSWSQGGGVSESHKSKWLLKVGVSMGVTP